MKALSRFITGKKISFVLGAALLTFGAYFFSRGTEETLYETVPVKIGSVLQEVSVTGRVESESNVDLAFERSGRVISEPRGIGERVLAGAILVRLDTSELEASRAQARANLNYEEIKLEELKKGARPEEVAVSEAKVTSAEISLADAQTALADKLVAANTVVDDAIFNKTDYLFDNPRTANPRVAFPATDQKLIASLEEGRLGITNTLNRFMTVRLTFEGTLDMRKAFFAQVKTYLDELALAVNGAFASSAYSQTTIDGWKTDVSTARTNLNTAITSLVAAEEKYQAAASTLTIAENELLLKKSEATRETLAAQEAKIVAVRASIENYNAQIDKMVLRAPFAGMVTKQDAKRGETVSANTQIVSLISEGIFQIDTHIPEVDIAKVKLNDHARVTLDAYGSDAHFDALVSAIDPGETVVEGVPTYKVTLSFAQKDERIKQGMTANIDIETAKRDGVLVLPARAVVGKNGSKSVRVLLPGVRIPEERLVELGLRGSDGLVEVVSGLHEGDSVVTFEKK
jgi:HlyD family secretion protein